MGQLDRALAVNATLSEACYGRSNAYRSLGDLDKAITDSTQVLRVDPDFAVAYYNHGLACGYREDYDRAIADYETALRIDPNHTLTRNKLAIARRVRGRYWQISRFRMGAVIPVKIIVCQCVVRQCGQ